MARDNYSYKKYQRELTKKKKKEEKLLKKLNKKAGKDAEGAEITADGQAPDIVDTPLQAPQSDASGVTDPGSGDQA